MPWTTRQPSAGIWTPRPKLGLEVGLLATADQVLITTEDGRPILVTLGTLDLWTEREPQGGTWTERGAL